MRSRLRSVPPPRGLKAASSRSVATGVSATDRRAGDTCLPWTSHREYRAEQRHTGLARHLAAPVLEGSGNPSTSRARPAVRTLRRSPPAWAARESESSNRATSATRWTQPCGHAARVVDVRTDPMATPIHSYRRRCEGKSYPRRAPCISSRRGAASPPSHQKAEHLDAVRHYRLEGMDGETVRRKVAFARCHTGHRPGNRRQAGERRRPGGVNQRPSDDPTETLRRIKDAGAKAFPVVADVRDPEQVVAMVREVARRGGRLDYVISNAGINPMMSGRDIGRDFNAPDGDQLPRHVARGHRGCQE